MAERVIPSSVLDNCDLYFEWGYDTQFEFVFRDDKDSIGLLIEWRNYETAQRAVEEAKRLQIFVPNIYSGHSEGEGAVKIRLIWAITVPKAQLDSFLNVVFHLADRIELAAPVTESPFESANLLASKSKGKVLAAVLDDGCSFANAQFRQLNGTRVIWLWNQNADAGGAPLSVGNGPSSAANFGYGGQLSKADLDKIFPLSESTQDETYREAGLPGLRRAASHGTHVMDLLAGEESWEIAFVQFPQAGIDDPSGLWLKRYALDGLHYAVECAGKNTTTIVANISWGPQTGPHDGSSILETAIETLIAEQKGLPQPRALVVSLPAGNSFGSQSHARIDYANGGQVDWLVPPDGEVPAFIELWWPHGVPMGDVCLRVTPPSGPSVSIAPGKTIATDKTWWVKLKTIGQSAKALVVVHPTGGFAKTATRGQHGRWKIEIDPTPSGADGDIHVYVARADHNMGARRRAKGSYLSDAALEVGRYVAPSKRFDEVANSAIRRSGTMNGIATGASTYTAAGYIYHPLESSAYSSSGPTRGTATKPDFACVTDRSAARPGIRASGVRSGTKTVLVGTSTAAPQLGRKIVHNLPPPPPPIKPVPYRKERVGAGCLPPDSLLVPPS